MALTMPSTFLYDLTVDANNRSIDFQIVALGPEKQATLNLGFYSLSGLMIEIKRAMEEADPTNTYTVTADRTLSGGTQNRVTISTSGAFLSLLFATGTRTASTTAPLIGFAIADQTGNTTYTGTSTSGTLLVTNLTGYHYTPPEMDRKNFGTLNISASGLKEPIVFSTQYFFSVQFKYIPTATANAQWAPLMTWMIAQKGVDFTPEITSPTLFYDCTLESTGADSKGLAYKFTEQLDKFPNLWDTGVMRFRVTPT